MMLTVATHEFLFTVKRPAYLILTLGMPVIVLAYAGLIGVITAVSGSTAISGLRETLGIVDESGLLPRTPATTSDSAAAQPAPPTGSPQSTGPVVPAAERVAEYFKKLDDPSAGFLNFKFFDDADAAQRALLGGEVANVLIIPSDYVESGRLRLLTRQWRLISSSAPTAVVVKRLSDGILRRAGLTDTELARTRVPPSVGIFEYKAAEGHFVEIDKTRKIAAFALPIGVGVVLMLSLMLNAGFLASGIAEEKENKVIEVLLSSVSADQLLMGKVCGLGAAALLQIAAWLTMAGFVPLLMTLALGRQIPMTLNVGQLLLAGVFFVLGFVFYGSLLVGLGSLGSNVKESQQWSVSIILLLIIPLMTAATLLDAPNSTFARVLSWLPPFGPPAMMFRLGTGQVAWWDAALAVGLMLVGIWLAIRIAARLFRAGTLMYGKSPSLIAVARIMLKPD